VRPEWAPSKRAASTFSRGPRDTAEGLGIEKASGSSQQPVLPQIKHPRIPAHFLPIASWKDSPYSFANCAQFRWRQLTRHPTNCNQPAVTLLLWTHNARIPRNSRIGAATTCNLPFRDSCPPIGVCQFRNLPLAEGLDPDFPEALSRPGQAPALNQTDKLPACRLCR
jgi:hypothetical protein